MKNIYYLKWNSRSLLLSEKNDRDLISALEEEDIRILHGEHLSEDDLRSIKLSLKVSIEKGVNRWIADSRFLLHCVMAAAVFLVSYYFLSYVIRDPLPVVDEVVLSGVLAFLAYIRLRNQEYRSEKAVSRKLELEQSLSDLSCESSPFLSQAELYLEKLAGMKDKERNEMIESGGVPVFFSSEKKQLLRFYKALNRSGRKVKKNYPRELKELIRQIRDFLKYHSSMV